MNMNKTLLDIGIHHNDKLCTNIEYNQKCEINERLYSEDANIRCCDIQCVKLDNFTVK